MSSVYRWYTQLDHRLFVYDTCKTMKVTRARHGWVRMFITHRPTLTLQLYNFDLFRTCRTGSFCTIAWQLARFQLTRRITRSLGNSWASCHLLQYCSHFRNSGAISWSFLNPSWYLMVPFILFIHQFPMYSFYESSIPLSSTITFCYAPSIQFDPVVSCLSLTICFAIRKISFWHSESFGSFAHSFRFFSCWGLSAG